MSRISSVNTFPEMIVRKILYANGYRYRLHRKDLPGKPDIVFYNRKKVLFINGCFWHGHKKCSRARLPLTNKDFWFEKITKNIKRDKENKKAIKKIGWSYLVLWQCELIKQKHPLILKKLEKYLDKE